jgi:GrpB-like predicted nucleotidyltransferase (UPF0157 family)
MIVISEYDANWTVLFEEEAHRLRAAFGSSALRIEHLCEAGGEQEWKHLAFRDYLRAHAQTAQEYAALKCELARAHDASTLQAMEAYSLAKSEFVARVLRAAKAGGDGGA